MTLTIPQRKQPTPAMAMVPEIHWFMVINIESSIVCCSFNLSMGRTRVCLITGQDLSYCAGHKPSQSPLLNYNLTPIFVSCAIISSSLENPV